MYFLYSKNKTGLLQDILCRFVHVQLFRKMLLPKKTKRWLSFLNHLYQIYHSMDLGIVDAQGTDTHAGLH